jgi:C-terminal processing protease CtpA/Prc
MDKNSVAALLKSTTGMLTIVVENPMGDPSLVESMIAKVSPDTKTGLVLTSNVSVEQQRIKVSRVDPNSIFSESLLNRRDTILSINDNQMENLDVMEAAQIIVKAKRNVTVVAERQAESAVVVSL